MPATTTRRSCGRGWAEGAATAEFSRSKANALAAMRGSSISPSGSAKGSPESAAPALRHRHEPRTQRVIVGEAGDLMSGGFEIARCSCRMANRRRPSRRRLRSAPRIPARRHGHPAGRRSRAGRAARPATAVTPGQAAVFYDGERVLGGGWIGRGR